MKPVAEPDQAVILSGARSAEPKDPPRHQLEAPQPSPPETKRQCAKNPRPWQESTGNDHCRGGSARRGNRHFADQAGCDDVEARPLLRPNLGPSNDHFPSIPATDEGFSRTGIRTRPLTGDSLAAPARREALPSRNRTPRHALGEDASSQPDGQRHQARIRYAAVQHVSPHSPHFASLSEPRRSRSLTAPRRGSLVGAP